MSIDRDTHIGRHYHKKKYIPMDKLFDYYNGLMKQRKGLTKSKDLERIDREIEAIKEIFKETAHE